ncbi:unnamed protein product [Dibothriocephalus latus]|uniref:Uncharacterized protein n=1 Tax=Dibothriocephalus latus TaxID=60516 RepID=A0A3P7KVS5_DIBLA|nr:unnamed protein product [Dibothriocephalus latus]
MLRWDPTHLLEEDHRGKKSFLYGRTRSMYTSGYDYPANDYEVDTIVETVQFTKAIDFKEVLRLKESKSPAPDEVSAKMLKEIASELAKPLFTPFRASFETGYLPADWKSARITPLYKGGNWVSTAIIDRSP